MTTAVSIDDDAPDEVTDAMDAVCAQLERLSDGSGKDDGFVSSAARRVLERTEW